jgi:hypothetical protein
VWALTLERHKKAALEREQEEPTGQNGVEVLVF